MNGNYLMLPVITETDNMIKQLNCALVNVWELPKTMILLLSGVVSEIQ